MWSATKTLGYNNDVPIPIEVEINKEKATVFDPQIYLTHSEDLNENIVEVFYQTRIDMVKGKLTLKQDFLSFEAN